MPQLNLGSVANDKTGNPLRTGGLEINRSKTEALNVQSFGAKGDGATDDTVAVQTAMTAASGRVLYFPPGTYLLSAEVIGVSNVSLQGFGATIKAITRFRSYFNFTNKINIVVEDLTFDLGQPILQVYADYPTQYNIGVYFDTCGDMHVLDCTFTNLYTNALAFIRCYGKLDIERCKFTSPAQTQMLMMEHIAIQTCANKITILNNDFANTSPSSPNNGVCGVFLSGTTGSVQIVRNRFDYCGRNNAGAHRLGVIDFYGNSILDVTVTRNDSTNGLAQFMRLSSVTRAEVDHNHISTASIAEIATQMISVESTITFLGVGQVGVQGVNIHHNTFNESTDTTRTGIAVTSYDYSVPSTDIAIHHNRFLGVKQCLLVGGPYSNLSFNFNRISGTAGGTLSVLYTAGGVTITASNGVTEAQSIYDNLVVRGNTFDLGTNNATTISLDWSKTPEYTGTIGRVDISQNVVRTATANSAQGIALKGSAAASQVSRVTLRENEVDNYAYAFYPRNFNEVTLELNKTRNIATGQILQSGNGVVNQSGNRWSAGLYSGRAVLVGGTVTVNTVEIQTGDNVQLTRVVQGGTAHGDLEVGTIVNGTSFVINAKTVLNALETNDTSTIFWQIIH